MIAPRFTIKISVFEKPGYAPLVEVIVKERGEAIYVASCGDLRTIMDAAVSAIAECEGAAEHGKDGQER